MTRTKIGKLVVAAVWAGLLLYAFTAAPPDDPTLAQRLIRASFGGPRAGLDPAVLAVWNMLGVVPLLYLSLLVPDGRRQRVWSWPFGLLMMAGGAFILVPWLLLRTEQDSAARPWRLGMRIVRSGVFRYGIVATLLGHTLYGVFYGSASGFMKLFSSTGLVNVMTFDLLLCAGLLPYYIALLRRRKADFVESPWERPLLWIPLFGPALWSALCYRPAPIEQG